MTDLQNYNEYLRLKKLDELNQKKSYKDYLDHQAMERSMINQNNKRMTREEKNMNSLDLEAFKQKHH